MGKDTLRIFDTPTHQTSALLWDKLINFKVISIYNCYAEIWVTWVTCPKKRLAPDCVSCSSSASLALEHASPPCAYLNCPLETRNKYHLSPELVAWLWYHLSPDIPKGNCDLCHQGIGDPFEENEVDVKHLAVSSIAGMNRSVLKSPGRPVSTL